VTERPKGERRDAAPPPTESADVEEPVAKNAATDALPDGVDGLDDEVEEGAPEECDDLEDQAAQATHSADNDEKAENGEKAEKAGEAEGSASGGQTAPDPAQLERALAERTADLQRLQAEYVNYKRRVERDRELIRENATYAALSPIVEVLDTIDRARDSARSLGGELEDGLRAVAEQLERVVTNAGLVKYGEPGDTFDPRIHEALSHIGEDPDVEVTTCKVIAKAGYRIGDRVVRAAQVLVVDPVSS
jgi:molecular chaperone GrpE